MKAFFITLFKSCLFLLVAASFQISQAFNIPLAAPQNGPNCFNTTLLALGYIENVIYTSSDELEFYLKNYCSPSNQKSSNILTFSNNQLVHTAFIMPNGLILEKNSLYGTLMQDLDYDPAPGQYLVHNESLSLFNAKNSQALLGDVYERKAFQCLPAQAVKTDLARFHHPAIKEQLQYRSFISKFIYTKDRRTLESELKSQILPKIKSLQWEKLSKNNLDQKSKAYLLGLLRSNAYQTHLLLCSESHKTEGECYVPNLADVKSALDQWFDKIYKLEN